jgi:hypothetical protein
MPSLLAERAASEGPRSMCAVEGNLGHSLQYRVGRIEERKGIWQFPVLAQRAVADSPRWTRAPWEPAWPPLILSVLQMETQEKRIRAIAESAKVSTSFVHKTCKNFGPQTLEIPTCKN